MSIRKPLSLANTSIAALCDRGIVFSTCALVFFLPISIALLDSFAGLVIFFYVVKKISQIAFHWPLRFSHLNVVAKARFIIEGLTPGANILGLPLQFLVLVFFISVLQSQYFGLSLFAFFGKFLKGIFLYFSFIEAFVTVKRIQIFLNILLASAFVVLVNGVSEHYWGVDFLKGQAMAGGRINSSFSTCNGLGAYLLPVIGIESHLLYLTIAKNRVSFLQGFLIVLLMLLIVCLCWTYSRSAWLGFLGILLFMVWEDRRKVLYAGILFLIFIFLFLPSLSHVRHLSLINDNNPAVARQQTQDKHSSSTVSREQSDPKHLGVSLVASLLQQGGSGRRGFWEKAVSIIRTSPILGTGLNTYSRILKRNPDPKTWWYAHNCYLQLTAETGLLGLACFLWMLFVLFQQGLNSFRALETLWSKTVLQGTLAGLFGFFIQSFFDNTFYTVQLGVLMWLVIGLAVAVMRSHTNE
ncbi:MAG: O-antigen ligase family protein [Candidatus Omnitrophica bacterium]|nr:O-antigen ligase family protein [Candidatus Omnitrophota bacterium]